MGNRGQLDWGGNLVVPGNCLHAIFGAAKLSQSTQRLELGILCLNFANIPLGRVGVDAFLPAFSDVFVTGVRIEFVLEPICRHYLVLSAFSDIRQCAADV